MAMQVQLVSPDKLLATVEADAVMLPGADGDFTVMEGHVARVTSLRPGQIRIRHDATEEDYVIAGGFAEISGSEVSVLAEFASHVSEAKPEMFQSMLDGAEEALERMDSKADNYADAAKRRDDLTNLIQVMQRSA